MKKNLLSILLGSLALLSFPVAACDAGKTLVKATVPGGVVGMVPFNYADCVTPNQVTFTVVSSKVFKTAPRISVRILDQTTGIEYLTDPYAPISSTFVLTVPAAGHSLVVELLNGTGGKVTFTISVR